MFEFIVLLPCDCGSTNLETSGHGSLRWIECRDCGATGPADQDYVRARDRWNQKHFEKETIG